MLPADPLPSFRPSCIFLPAVAARKYPLYIARRVRLLFQASCPAVAASGGGGKARRQRRLQDSAATTGTEVQSDPAVVLLRGKGCMPHIQQLLMVPLAGTAAGDPPAASSKSETVQKTA